MDIALLQRHTKDACLIRQFTLPAAGAPVIYSDALDLGPSQVGLLARSFDVEIALDAAPALADGHKVTLTLQDSADGVNFLPVPGNVPYIVTGDGGNGSDAGKTQFPVALSIRRYVRLSAGVDAGGGDNTAVNATLSLVF